VPQAELVEILVAHSGQLCGWLVLGVILACVVDLRLRPRLVEHFAGGVFVDRLG
jgi:hypothetical protein